MNPRPRARTASVYRFVRPIELSRRGQRTNAPSRPYPGSFSPDPSGLESGVASVSYESCGLSRRRDRGSGLRYLRSESVVVVVGN